MYIYLLFVQFLSSIILACDFSNEVLCIFPWQERAQYTIKIKRLRFLLRLQRKYSSKIYHTDMTSLHRLHTLGKAMHSFTCVCIQLQGTDQWKELYQLDHQIYMKVGLDHSSRCSFRMFPMWQISNVSHFWAQCFNMPRLSFKFIFLFITIKGTNKRMSINIQTCHHLDTK